MTTPPDPLKHRGTGIAWANALLMRDKRFVEMLNAPSVRAAKARRKEVK